MSAAIIESFYRPARGRRKRFHPALFLPAECANYVAHCGYRVTTDQLRRMAKPRAAAPIRTAFVHIGLGETDRAFEWLLKAFEARDWQMVMLKVEPSFDPLRADPRFAALVERVGLPR